MVTYLNKNQWNLQCHNFSLFFCYSNLNNMILSSTFNLNVSQMNWLSCQIFTISKQALDFASQISKKCTFFWQHPLMKWFGPRPFAPWKSLKNQILSNFWLFFMVVSSFSWHDKIHVYFVSPRDETLVWSKTLIFQRHIQTLEIIMALSEPRILNRLRLSFWFFFLMVVKISFRIDFMITYNFVSIGLDEVANPYPIILCF